jgi:uncharacterized protein
MKLYAFPGSHNYSITGYGPGWIAVNGRQYDRSLLVRPDGIDPDWGPAPGQPLAADHLAALAAFSGTVVLLGTGSHQRFPAAPLLRPLIEASVGIEVMDTGAACRTYNILLAEGRDVAAALIIE